MATGGGSAAAATPTADLAGSVLPNRSKMLYKTSPSNFLKFPTFFPPPMPARSRFSFPSGYGDLFFRDAETTLSLVKSNANFVVYFISSHSSLLPDTFTPPIIGDNIPYCVVQTGARESVGCSFTYGGNMLMKNLFSKNLPFTFQYLLGLQNENIPQVFADLHYATNDVITIKNVNMYESIPNKLLSFDIDELVTRNFGVYMYDPHEGEMGGLFGSKFKRLENLNKYFMRWNPAMSNYGITIQDLLPLIISESGFVNRPSVFVFYGCSDLKNNVVGPSVNIIGKESFYQYRSGVYPLIPSAYNLPNISKPNSRYSYIPADWRRVEPHSSTVRRYFNKKLNNVHTLFGNGIAITTNNPPPPPSNETEAAAAAPPSAPSAAAAAILPVVTTTNRKFNRKTSRINPLGARITKNNIKNILNGTRRKK